jgi:hypothetical protein
MITKEQALTANEFHENGCTRDADGPRYGRGKEHILRWRRNGKTQIWKTRPNAFRVPVKRGLKEYAQIHIYHADQFHTPEFCPLNVYITGERKLPLCEGHGGIGEEASHELINRETGGVTLEFEQCILCIEDPNLEELAQATLVKG